MTTMTDLHVRTLHALIFNMTCHRIHSRSDQRRFFAQMRRVLAERGYAMSQWQGFCVVIALHEQEPRAGRNDILNWIVDQSELAEVIVHGPMAISDLLTGRFTIVNGRDEALAPQPEAVARMLVRHIAAGAVTQALRRLRRPRLRELPWRTVIPST